MAEPPQKRFRYATYNEQIKNISVDVGKQRGLGWEKDTYDEDTEQTSTPLTSELDRLSLLDLTTPYQDLQRTLIPITSTLPITLHNLPLIQQTFSDFYLKLQEGQEYTHSGLDSALYLHQALFETCLSEALPHIPDTTRDLLRVGALRALDPKLVERTYSTLSLILRSIASALLKSDGSNQAILRATWKEVRPYLRPKENKKYVRKCVADAWVGVIRKARSEGLQRLMDVLLEEETEGMEAVWSHSLKGTNGQLHSRALAIYEILIDRVILQPTEQQITTVNMVSTALVHHCSTSAIKPVIEIVIARVDRSSTKAEPSSSSSSISLSTSTTAIRILSTFLLTRKGKRFPEALLKPLMQHLQALFPHLASQASLAADNLSDEERENRDTWRKALVACVVGCLQAGQLQHWLSPGVGLIESLWNHLDDRECFAFSNALVALKWPGIEQFLLSHIAKSSLPSLQKDPLSTLVLLNNLASAGYLSGGLSNVQGGRWRQSFISSNISLLDQLKSSGVVDVKDKRILGQVLKLIPALPSDVDQFAPHITALIRSALSSSEGKQATDIQAGWEQDGAWNDSHVLGSLLGAAQHIIDSPKSAAEEELKTFLVKEKKLEEILNKWSWSREVLIAASPLVDRWSSELSLPEDHFLALFQPNLLSADSHLRLSTVQILASISSTSTPAGAEEHVPSHSGLWSLCVAVESSEMTLRNVRDRTTSISRLSRAILYLYPSSVEAGDLVAKGVLTYLVAQLKVNFRPVYAETITALSSLATKQGETIWEIIWEELQKTDSAKSTSVSDLGISKPSWADTRRDESDSTRIEREEDEAEFHCHNLEKSRNTLNRVWIQATHEDKLDQQEVSAQISHDRLDVLNYEAQLLATLAAVPSIAEKHSRSLIPLFFGIAQQNDDDEARSTHLSTKQRQQRTASYLELLAKFANPKAAYRSDELHALYLDILAKGENKLQSLALKCLMTYKSPKLLPYQESLVTLLEDSQFRDELARLRLSAVEQDYGVQSQEKSALAKTRVVIIDPPHRDEALPVIIRLLFGIMTSRKGKSSSAQGQTARKQAVLNALSGCTEDELKTLIDLMLEPFGEDLNNINVTGRQQIGFLSLLTDVIRYLGPQIVPHWPRLVNTTIALVASAQKKSDQANIVTEDGIGNQDDNEDVDDLDAEGDKGLAPLRNIRSVGLKRLVQFFRSPVQFDFKPYLPTVFQSIISPRLDRLEVENTQAPSGTLELIATIAASPDIARSLVEQDDRTLSKAFSCITAVKVKPAVILKVFDIIDSILIEDSPGLTEDVLLPNIRVLLDNVIGLVVSLKASANEDLTRRLLAILSRLAAIVSDGHQAQELASLLAPMLRQRQTTEKAKTNILSTLQRLYAISPDFMDPTSKYFTQNYELISNLFQTLFFPSSRRALFDALQTFANIDGSLVKAIHITGEINAYSARRMDEPDFDRRLTAYAQINDGSEEDLPATTKAWLPILRSSLFYLQEPEELSIRTSASSVLQRFITVVGQAESGPYVETLQHVIMPGIKKSLRNKQELVRNEAIHIIAHAVKTCTSVPELAELQGLLAEGDDEASFFTNITHIQVHRRARALHRLRNFVSENKVQESTLSTIFLPVLEHIVAGSTDVTDHHLINESVQTIGGLAGELRWSRYYGLIGRFMKLGSVKSQQQKIYIRVVSAIIDNFHFNLGTTQITNGTAMEVDGQEDDVADKEVEVEEDEEIEVEEQVPIGTSPERISEVILNRLLPSLSKFVATKDETESNIRIPLALAVVKLAHALPRASSADEVLRVITTVSQILRSKEQDTRDIARDTVCKIAVYLGPEWLVRVIKELETALQRGPQKHVLAVTTHAILVLATTQAADRFADLDDAVELAVSVSAEVIWGESGKDVAAEGFKTKMREVRGATSRGFDTFQLLSQLVSPSKMSTILSPLREVMHSSQAVKQMQQVDEALRRISLGLNSNSKLGPEDILSLCYSLISGNSSYLKPKQKAVKPAETPDSFRVQMKRDNTGKQDFYPQNAHKFVVFGLDLFVTAFRRGKFDFDDVSILSRLSPMVNAIGNTLYSPASNVLTLALKASAAVVRCPVPQVESALPVFITNIFKIIKRAGGTAEGEVAQTALKTLAVILRDCKSSEVTENQLKYLLEAIGPDLEEPDRQSAIFTILRSIITRKFVVPEIYDLMERVSSIMVTSQSTQVQDLCRGAVMAFLLDYPQGKGRLKNQMTFFARNLQYTFEAGRVSVMEVLNTIFIKFSDELIEEYSDIFFVALVVVLANDDSEKCRQMAGELLKTLWKRLEQDKRNKMSLVLKSWVEKRDENNVLASAALGVFGLLVESGQGEGLIEQLIEVTKPVIEESAEELLEAEASEEVVVLDHGLPHQALSSTSKAISQSTSVELPWKAIIAHLLFPHSWVRYDAARLLSNYLTSSQSESPYETLGEEELLDISRKGCIVLNGSKADDGEFIFVDGKLSDEIVKVLYNIAKHWAATQENETELTSAEDVQADGEDEAEINGEEDQEEENKRNPLSWLMSRMSFLARHLLVNRPPPHSPQAHEKWSAPILSILRFFAGVYESLTAKQGKVYLMHILSPIYRILDEGGDLANAEDSQIEELRQLSTQIREFVQTKAGTSAFSSVWEKLRRATITKRENRREDRVKLAITNPVKFAEKKSKKVIRGKEGKKRKMKTFQEGKAKSSNLRRRRD